MTSKCNVPPSPMCVPSCLSVIYQVLFSPTFIFLLFFICVVDLSTAVSVSLFSSGRMTNSK